MKITPVLCPDCATPEGHLHDYFPYCDQEICPLCGEQLCGCPHVTRLKQVIKAGRIPFLYFPWLCAKCGTVDPPLWMVSDEEWCAIIPAPYRHHILCRPCFDHCAALQVAGGTLGLTWGKKPAPPVDDATLPLL